ncbi:MAG: hypothetical protein M1282_05235 [Chloroflexi bacterium]|nr:hypothetical protein [Chloroflexota bacterium]
MKKTLLIVVLLLAALSVVGVGAAAAQGFGGGRGPMISSGEGPLHDYIIKAYADALKLTPDVLESRLTNGETVYQIALSQGIAADQIPTLLADARSKALDAAVAAGVITADQSTWMKSRGFGRGGFGYGMGAGVGPCNGTGQPIGSGMMRGGRWGQANP